METRKIEVYIGFINYQWDTRIVDIPVGTPESEVLTTAENEILKSFESAHRLAGEIAFIGIYNDNLIITEEVSNG